MGIPSPFKFLGFLFNNLPRFFKNPFKARIVIEEVKSGSQQQHEVINSVTNLAKKNILKKC